MITVVFACVHNAGRSQMAAAWFNALADPAKAHAISAGTEPGPRVHPEVVEVMREVGIDLSSVTPRLLTDDVTRDASLLVTMGCGETCPFVPGLRRMDWPLEDPKGKPIGRVREMRDEVRGLVATLIAAESHGGPVLEARVPQDAIASLYGRIAWIYDAWAMLTETRARQMCIERAGVRDGERVLEVAVGTGLAFRELVRANPSGITEGIDLTDAMLAHARSKVASLPGRHRLRVGDAHRLDFADGAFDLVVNNYMFDLLPEADFEPVLRELRRVLASGGRLVLVNMATSTRATHRIYEWIYRRHPSLLGGCRGVELGPFVQQAGFSDVRTERITQLGFASELVTARA
jgi:arsenate reductase